MTTGSFGIDPVTGQFTVKYGSRTVQTTGGTLVCLLPTLHSFAGRTVTFPDPPKDWIYAWRGRNDYGFNPSPSEPDSYAQSQVAVTFFTRTPQEYESAQTLMAAPDGADFFVGFVKLTRTTAPSHTWSQRDLLPLQKEGQWIPWMGSGLMEAGVGLARAMHLVIEGGSLKLVAEQSVGPPTGGASHTWGHYPSIFVSGNDREGGIFEYDVAAGQIVWWSTDSPYGKSASRIVDTDFSPGQFITLQRTGSNPTSTTDPTNYQSIYSVDVKGYFGRRS